MSQKQCSIEGCGKPHKARGWCEKHYDRWRAHGDPLKTLIASPGSQPVCSIAGCGRPRTARGWCSRHYQRWCDHGDPLTTMINPPGEGSVDDDGYRVFRINGVLVREHRKVMEEQLGRRLEPGEIVHHEDEDKLNNDPDNLKVTTQPQHMKLHATFRSATHKECAGCHEVKPRSEFSPVRHPTWDPHQAQCKRCRATRARERQHQDRLPAVPVEEVCQEFR